MENWIVACAIGLLAGFHTATWGMYKDAPYEGYSHRRYLRSVWLSTVIASIAYPLSGLDLAIWGHRVVFFGLVYVIERAFMEFYKTFVREEDQSKYFIPMQFHIRGRVVKERGKRLMIGLAYAAGVLLVVAFIFYLQQTSMVKSSILVVIIGSLGGWISAFGGAWKDAPIEGFEILKFFRSPVIAGFYAFILGHFTDHLVLITFPALGYTIATIETYKTFFFPSKPRGKFAGKPVRFPEMLRKRQRYVPLYVIIWTLMLLGFVMAIRMPHSGYLQII